MDRVCGNCKSLFYSNLPRSVCFTCKPHPKISNPRVVLDEYALTPSYRAISRRLGVSIPVIESYVINFGVPRHNSRRLGFPKVSFDKEWFDGWLLGDGSLGMGGNSLNAHAGHSSAYKEYCEYVASNWRRGGFTHCSVSEELQEAGNISYHVLSHVHPVLTDQYCRWYPEGEKRVPSDVNLTSVVLREWYLGDGLLQGTYPKFALGNVMEQEVDFLLGKLRDIFGSGVTKQYRPPNKYGGIERKEQWILNIGAEAMAYFFHYIGPCTLPCYKYRWVDWKVCEMEVGAVNG